MGLLLAVLVVSGCGAKTDDEPAAPPPSSTPSVVPSAVPSLKIKTEPPTDAFQELTAKGRVRITGACVELVTEQLNWVLIGPAAAKLLDGQQVRATGVPDPNRETGCTGSPLLVSSVAPV